MIEKKNKSQKNIVGIKLRNIRSEKGVSQVDLSRKLMDSGVNLTNSALSKVEAGSRGVFDYELLGIAHCLDTTVNSFFDDEELGISN